MSFENLNVLLVDDMSAVRKWEKNQLLSLGIRNILEAENGEEAYDVLCQQEANGTSIHLIFSDWHMPILDGLGLLKKIREDDRFKSIPFVMVSAEGEAPKVLEAIGAGVTNYIRKPFKPEVLAKKLSIILEQK